MKKVLFIAAVAIATGLSSCAQAPKAELKTEIDSLSYAIGLSRSQQGLTQFLEQQGVDSAQYSNFFIVDYEHIQFTKNLHCDLIENE